MSILNKLIAGSAYRKTRAHSEKGQLGLRGMGDWLDCAQSLRTHAVRILAGSLPELPWLTYPAMRFLECNLRPDATVFEFGGGMSTLWYERRCAEVHTVEDNPEWYELVKTRAARAHITHAAGQDFIESIHQFPVNYFDLVVVDGNLDRFACFQHAERHVKPGGLIVADDTDKEQVVYGPITKLDQFLSSANKYEVHRFVGWVPGSFWVKETTICRKV